MVRSLLAQTFTDFEIVAVDDGSTDGSGDLLDRLATEDNRIRVIHQTNAGVSAARQMGLDNARGEYTIHADADDWVEPNMLEKLYSKAIEEDADVVFCDFYRDDSKGNATLWHQQPPTEPDKALRALFQQLHGSCCNKLVKRACYNRYNIRFPEGLNYCEDLLTWVQMFQHQDLRISYVSEAFYHYVEISDSICHVFTRDLFNYHMIFVAKLQQLIGNEYPDIVEAVKLGVKGAAFSHPIFSSDEYYKIFPELNRKILKCGMPPLDKFLMYMSYSGFYRICTSLYKLKNKIRGHHI
jgi:glycosyltransferase involved in cell wall biosynthesis